MAVQSVELQEEEAIARELRIFQLQLWDMRMLSTGACSMLWPLGCSRECWRSCKRLPWMCQAPWG